jgi:hypothetical protein
MGLPTTSWPAPLRDPAFHGVLGEIVNALAPQTEADPAAVLLQMQVMFGNLIGRTAHFRVGADRHYLNLFVGVVGDTSKARKGVSRGLSQRVFAAVDADWADRCITSGLSSGEGLIWAVRDAIEKQQPIKEGGRVVDYQTVVEDPGVVDKRLLVIEPELASTLKVMSREGNTLSAVVRQAWDGQTLQTITKGSPARATAPHISVIGQITRDELLRYLEATEAANGFGNRFLWVAAKRSRELPDGGGDVDVTGFHSRLVDAVGFARNADEIVRDPAARAMWHRVYGRLSAGKPGMFGAMTARAEAQVMRLACLYAVADMSYVVRPEHLRAGLEVWRYCQSTAAYLFGGRLGDPTADDILAALRRVWPDSLTRTEITHDVFKRNKPGREMDRAFALLQQHGLATVDEDRSGEGRPVERWAAADGSPDDDINDINDISPPDPDPYVVSDVNVVAPEAAREPWEDIA